MSIPGKLAALRLAVQIAIVVTFAFTGTAAAATLTVNTTSDAAPTAGECTGSAECSLRQAIDKAAPGDTVSLPAEATAYSVTLGVITIGKGITISGAGARTTTIDADGTSQIFDVSGLPTSSTLTVSAVTISGGDQSGSTPSDGSGGAIDVDSAGATVDLSGVALSDNTASVAGGAIELSAGNMDITGSTLGPDNVASGNSDFPGTGGAIDNDNGTLSISDSTISGNSAGVADVAPGRGGGISDESSGITGTTMLQYDTIAYNTATGTGATGGNLYTTTNDPDGFTISDTIVADGAAPTGGDCYNDGDFVSEGYNLTDGIASTGVAACGFTQTTDVLGDARLGPLTNNGGQTDTEALAAGSPAIDAIPNSNASCTGTDQRGDARPEGSGCDIGALEAGYGETAPQWSVAHDFRTDPEVNPSPDSLGNSDVWSYEQGPLADLTVPDDYTPLPSSGLSTTCTGSDLDFWANPGPSLPVVDFNAGSTTYVCSGTVTAPPQTVVMHPSGSDYSIVAWKSPVSGTIAVAGSFVSMDPNGGSGTTWDVDDGSTTLVSGTNAVGGSGSFEPAPFSVTAGDTLYFIVGPEGGATFETTELNLTITEAGASPPPHADLALTVSAPQSVSPGASVTDTFTVTNDGPDTSEGVTFVDTLPSAATYQSATPSQGNCFPPASGMISCSLGSLADGAHATVSVTLLTQSDFQGPLSNTADVSAVTIDPNTANNSATATTTVASPCTTSMTIDAVEVLAGCITEQSGGTYLATGDTRFGNGASIVDAGTQTPATLVLDPSSHQISIAPASGGGAQSGELEAGGLDIATGDLVINTQGQTDPVSGVAGTAPVTGMSSVDVTLSGWSFDDSGAVAPTAYLAPSSAGGGAIVDGQLALPAWLGDTLKFGSLVATGLVPGVSGELAVQASSSGHVSVVNGGISFKATVLGDSNLQLANAELSYQRAGDEWTGSGALGFASLVKLNVNATIGDGKLDDLGVDFACATSKICGSSSSLPTLGAILDLKDVDLNMINLQGINYTPPPTFSLGGPFHLPIACFTNRFVKCPPPLPAPQVDGAVIVGLLGDRVIAGGNFDYLLDGQFTASGGVGLAPLYGSKFSAPPPLAPGQSATNAVDNLLNTGLAGVELAGATIDYTPPGLLQATGTVYLPPPPFPFQFLKGTISIGIDASHFTGEGSLDLVIPNYVPLIHGDTFGGVQALISDEAAAAEASLPQYCASVDLGFHTYTECTPKITFLAAFDWTTGKVTVDMNGGNINDYATVAQLAASDAAAGASRFVHVPARKQLASFTVHSAKRTPDVELIGPRVAGHRRHLRLRTSKKLGNHTGALAWVDKKAHTECFLVLAPSGGRWTVKRLGGARITAVKVVVPRRKLKAKVYPHAVERAGDLPKGTVSTAGKLTLHYRVPNAGRGTTVDLWAGTGPHGAGGTMIADGLRPSGAATWKLSGLASGRYYPYAIVSQNGIPVSIHYWPGSVEVVNSAAPAAPTGVQAAPEAGQVYVAWNGVQGAATYAVTATRSDGGSPVRDAVPASQVDDALTLAPGRWSITVQSVAAGDQASLPSAPTTVTVP